VVRSPPPARGRLLNDVHVLDLAVTPAAWLAGPHLSGAKGVAPPPEPRSGQGLTLFSSTEAVLVTPLHPPLSNRLGEDHAPNVSHIMCLRCAEKWTSVSPFPGARRRCFRHRGLHLRGRQRRGGARRPLGTQHGGRGRRRGRGGRDDVARRGGGRHPSGAARWGGLRGGGRHVVGRCRLTVSRSVLKAPPHMVSAWVPALETRIL
jgi:hypothetical protein